MAAAASVTWQTAQACIQSTVSLLSGCLKNGENVAVVFKDIGVLHIDGLTFHMKFYYDFLEKLSGKEKFRKALLKVSCSFLPPAPGQLLAPCKCCGAVSPPCLGLLVRPVPQPSQGRPTSSLFLPCRPPGCWTWWCPERHRWPPWHSLAASSSFPSEYVGGCSCCLLQLLSSHAVAFVPCDHGCPCPAHEDMA
ncbi:Uncharacterised protein [Chlamydia abortus]|nr:Uncharacterised protein [Chlamydia abortus]